MALDLSKTAVINGDDVRIVDAFALIADVQSTIEAELGVEDVRQPKTRPPDLGEGLADGADTLTNEQLAQLHAQYTSYAAFVNCRLAAAKAAYKVSETNLSHLKAKLSTEMYAKGGVAKTEVPNLVKADELFRNTEIEYLRLYMVRVILEARYDAYRKQAESISRLISLRTEEMQDARINIQGRGRSHNESGAPRRSGRFR